MKKMKLIAAGILALTVTLAGCGSSSGTTAGQPQQAGAENAESTAPVYTVATVRWADWGENYHTGFPDQAAAEAGITVNWDTILNSDWADKKAVLMAGGDLPDAFMGSICFSESDIMTNAGSFIALDDYIDEYMPNFKKIMENDPTMKALAVSSDGHIYGLPSKKPCRPVVANQMFINKKWLDNLGLEVPQTYEEFKAALKAFKEEDANGNGDPGDEIPFGQGYADSVMFFCLPFGTTIGARNGYDGDPGWRAGFPSCNRRL